jgi:hypothetical protein
MNVYVRLNGLLMIVLIVLILSYEVLHG